MTNILVTGGAGFIGSHVVRHLVRKYPSYNIFNIDKLTYAGNLSNLKDIEDAANYTFCKGDICDSQFVAQLFEKNRISDVIHLAAESHVDRSILGPMAFVETNVVGTLVLLQTAKEAWKKGGRFYHISTDEVYGSLGPTGAFTETTAYDPRSPYSASKASSDHMVRAFHHTYDMDVVISNCSNNYGPYQFPEKLIPLMIRNIMDEKPLPVYGKGQNIRDWIWVEDHVEAIDLTFHKGKPGETYNIGAQQEWRNIDLVHALCDVMDEKLGRSPGKSRGLITFVTDRLGHDMRYAIDPTKTRDELGWSAKVNLKEGLSRTVDWYLANPDWMEGVVSGAYLEYYERQYGS